MGSRKIGKRVSRMLWAAALFCAFWGVFRVPAAAAETLWYPLDPERLAVGETVAVTAEREDGIWALSPEGGTAEVSLEDGVLDGLGAELGWQIVRDGETLCLRSGETGELLQLSDPGSGHLCRNGDWLCLSGGEEPVWTAVRDPAQAQELCFWTRNPAEDLDPEAREAPFEMPEIPWSLYFGQLHAHTNLSDGRGTVEEAFRYAREEAGLDFFAVTDHSTSFDRVDGASAKWARGRAAARAASEEGFAGIFGYEMTWPDSACLGHIVTFATEDFLSTDEPEFNSLEPYYQALAAQPEAIGMFAHPGMFYGDFEDFSHWSAAYDESMNLLEVVSEGGYEAFGAYTAALDAGWHTAPAAGGNEHSGNWGLESRARTVVLAEELSEEGIYEALRSRRTYASEDGDLRLVYTLDGAVMGSRLPGREEAMIEVWLEDPTDPIGLVEVVAEGGEVLDFEEVEENQAALAFFPPGDYAYYFIRVTQPDGDTAVTAPVWLEEYTDMGIGELSVEGAELRGQEAELTLTLFNNEPVPLALDSVTLTAGGETIYFAENPGTVEPLEERSFAAAYTVPRAGLVEYGAEVCGTVSGVSRSWEAGCPVWYAEPEPESGPPEAAPGEDIRELSSIREVREGTAGGICRIRGYVTAGTVGAGRLEGMVCLQDASGGIAVVDFPEMAVQIGQGLEVLGIPDLEEGNVVLRCVQAELLDTLYHYVPSPAACEEAMDYESRGGELLQVEGIVEMVLPAEDGAGPGRFALRDEGGGLALLRLESFAGAGALELERLMEALQPGKSIRAVGILCLEDGKSVLRVRNFQEAVEILPAEEAPEPAAPTAPAAAETTPKAPKPPKPAKAPAAAKTKQRSKTVNVWIDPDYVPPETTLPGWRRVPDPNNPKTGDLLAALFPWLPR